MKKRTVFLIILAGLLPALAQTVSFTKIPVNFELFPRDESDSGTAVISGSVSGLGYDSIVVNVKKNGQSYKHAKTDLVYSGTSAPFSLSVRLAAELSEYTFDVYANTQRVGGADSVVAGDVYAFNGQSNMEASGSYGSYNWKLSEWVRSTGYAGTTAVWARAGYQCCFGNWPNDPFRNGPAGGGYVAANLGNDIALAYQTPVCVINAAYSGTRIEEHQPTAGNHANTSTYYGRLLLRAQIAGVVNQVKAVFWYQGEYHNSYTTYAGLWNNLYQAWKADFPGIQKIYVQQINTGCTEGGAYNAQIRDIHRKFQETYPDVTVGTAVGATAFTGCHFGQDGYAQMAQWWRPVYGHDFYGDTASNAGAPRLLSAAYSSQAHTALDLTFDMPVVWPSDPGMTNGIALGGATGVVSSASSIGNVLRLNLSSASSATTVSYVPANTYSGPYLYSARGAGVVTFLNFPISANTPAGPGLNPRPGQSLSASPNPCRASVRITLSGGPGVSAAVYDLAGRKIRAFSSARRAGVHTLVWDMTNESGKPVPAGIYVVRRIQDGKAAAHLRLAVVR